MWALYVKDFVTCASLQVYQAVRLNKCKPTSLNANMQISYLVLTDTQTFRGYMISWLWTPLLQYLYLILHTLQLYYYTILLSIKDGGNVQLFCGGELMHNEQRNFFSNYQHAARKKLLQSPWKVQKSGEGQVLIQHCTVDKGAHLRTIQDMCYSHSKWDAGNVYLVVVQS